MVNEKSGLSPKERSIVQDNGYTGIGQENDNFKVWKHRIKNKIRPTINDTLLLLKNRVWIEHENYISENCKNDLLEIRDLINEIYPLNNETNIDKGDNNQPLKLVSKF